MTIACLSVVYLKWRWVYQSGHGQMNHHHGCVVAPLRTSFLDGLQGIGQYEMVFESSLNQVLRIPRIW